MSERPVHIEQRILQIEQIVLQVGSEKILDHISLELIQGQVVAVVGPSGAGKSSLLTLINRLIDPTKGQILYKNKPLTDYPIVELRRAIGMVMQQPVLFPGTVRANLLYGPSLVGQSDDSVAIEYLKVVGLPSSYLDKDTAQLSGGEKQRVAFGRTLANHPEVLLLDEPTSALDPISTEHIEHTVRKLKSDQGVSVLWVTHSLEQAQRMGDKILVLIKGRVLGFGTFEELLAKPGAAGQFLKGNFSARSETE